MISDALSNFPEYDWLYTEYPRENSHDIGIAMSEGKIDPTAEALNALVNLILSSECQYFVGQVNSTWYRLMIMLAYGKYGQMPPLTTSGKIGDMVVSENGASLECALWKNYKRKLLS